MRGAYEQTRILLGRRDIGDVLADPSTPAEEREKLQLVLDARSFSETIGLKTGESFTTYSDIGKDTLSWVVVGSRKDAFSLYTWWFPIVGRVPYKGFFEKEDAQEQAAELEAEGYETWVRGADAFSTLGWFNDPILSTTLRSSPTRIANTVIHESVHPTVWIPGSVPFNESLANFVAMMATQQFFGQRVADCLAAKGGDCTREQAMLASARLDAEVQRDLGAEVQGLYEALDQLYRDPALSPEEKVSRRSAIFTARVTPLREKHRELKALQRVNNAEIMQLKIYLTELGLFASLYELQGRSWQRFIAEVEGIQRQLEQDRSLDPFQLLRERVGNQT